MSVSRSVSRQPSFAPTWPADLLGTVRCSRASRRKLAADHQPTAKVASAKYKTKMCRLCHDQADETKQFESNLEHPSNLANSFDDLAPHLAAWATALGPVCLAGRFQQLRYSASYRRGRCRRESTSCEPPQNYRKPIATHSLENPNNSHDHPMHDHQAVLDRARHSQGIIVIP